MDSTTMKRVGSTGVLAVTMALSVGLTSTGAASAAAPAPAGVSGQVRQTADHQGADQLRTAVRGATEDGRAVRGTFTATEFAVVDDALVVTGTLAGRITGQGKARTFRQEVTTPVHGVNGTSLAGTGARQAAAPTAAPTAAAAGACDVLNLDLGPLDLDVLGLEVHLQEVVLDVVAQSGAGKLLGNLVCAVAGLLDGGPLAGLLGQLSDLLNRILAVLGR